MEQFIAYFDYLGFKEFIENNDLKTQKRVMQNIFRDIERSLAQRKYKSGRHGLIADISKSIINCINFSDTVVFWTKDNSEESLIALLEVSHTFNREAIECFFPVRGSLVYGEIEYDGFNKANDKNVHYNINSVYGKGLVKSHLKANEQNWAGTVFDTSLIQELEKRGYTPELFLSLYAKKFKVPYKSVACLHEEFVFNLTDGMLNEVSLSNISEAIKSNFSDYNKSIESQGAKEKLKNTLLFLESYLVKENL